jgi:SAM-dependent methyltransferase
MIRAPAGPFRGPAGADTLADMESAAARIIDLYQRHAEAWAGLRLKARGLQERGWLERFQAIVRPGGSVLDIGCGAGAPIAAWLAGQGFRVTGIDSSPAMVAMFRARLPSETGLVADMRHLALGRRFDGLLAWDSFFHLDHADQRRMFPVFRAHATPGAALMFTSGPTHGEAIGSLEGEPLYHASLSPEEYRVLLEGNGFEVLAHIAEDPTCGGHTVWLARLR